MTNISSTQLTFATCGLVAAGLLVLAACSDSGAAPALPQPEDAGATLAPADDSGVSIEDGGVDGTPDVVDAGARICSDDGFCHSVVPAGRDLKAVWGDGLGTVWAASADGDVLRWDGGSWKQHTKVAAGVTAMWGSEPTDVWIATGGGLVHGEGASPDALVFASVDLPGNAAIPITSVWGTGPDDVWAAGGLVPISFPPAPSSGRVVHFTGNSPDGGSGWAVDDDASSRSIAFRGGWSSSGTGHWLHGVRSAPFTNPAAVVLRRRPGAAAWEVVDLPPDPNGRSFPQAREIVAASTSSDTSVWCAGRTGDGTQAMWHGTSADGGETFTWTFLARGFWERPIAAFWGAAPNETWAVGDTGLVTRWDGSGWKQAALRVSEVPVGKSFRAIWGANANDFWVVGDEVALHRTGAGKP